MRCWWCGAEPDGLVDVMVMESAQPIRQIPIWPQGDHIHAEKPPTPNDLLQQAYGLLNLRVA